MPFFLFVKSLTGKTTTLQVDFDDTVMDLKYKMQDKEGVPPSSQRFIYAGKELSDDSRTLESLNVGKECILHWIPSRIKEKPQPNTKTSEYPQKPKPPPNIHQVQKIIVIPFYKKVLHLWIVQKFIYAIRAIYYICVVLPGRFLFKLLLWYGRTIDKIIDKLFVPVFQYVAKIFTASGLIFDKIFTVIENIVESISTPIWNLFAAVHRRVLWPVLCAIGRLFRGIVNLLRDGITAIARIFWHLFLKFFRIIGLITSKIFNAINYAMSKFGSVLATIFRGLRSVTLSILKVIGQVFSRIFAVIGTATHACTHSVLLPILRALNVAGGKLLDGIWFVLSKLGTFTWTILLHTGRQVDRVFKCITWLLERFFSGVMRILKCIDWMLEKFFIAVGRIFARIFYSIEWLFAKFFRGLGWMFTKILTSVSWLLRKFIDGLKWIFTRIGRLFKFLILPIWRVGVESGKWVSTTLVRPVGSVVWNTVGTVLTKTTSVARYIFRPVFHLTNVILRGTGRFIALLLRYTLLKPLAFAWYYATTPLVWVVRRIRRMFTSDVLKVAEFGFKVNPSAGYFYNRSTYEMSYRMVDGQNYLIFLQNRGQNDAKCVLKIDGKEMGTFRLEPRSQYYIERPISKDKRFAFVVVDSNSKSSGQSEMGVVSATFYRKLMHRPRQVQRKPQQQNHRQRAGVPNLRRRNAPVNLHRHKQAKSASCDWSAEDDDSAVDGLLPGETRLRGKSHQQVNETADFPVDYSSPFNIRVRLVGTLPAGDSPQKEKGKYFSSEESEESSDEEFD
eukprot:TRINITY_DN5232_c0_g1_i1.p1 TRINITY_DN5232_c0_g1~~TRINITY_DN5232_c0_g1_i1.p1  ORF type:complete len:785 (-),score=44.43 TRINITY_DN5232_c0_g1_i1:73-2427(-)